MVARNPNARPEVNILGALEELVGLAQQSWTLQNTEQETLAAILQQLKQQVAAAEQTNVLLANIYAALIPPDVGSFNVSSAQPTKQPVGEKKMAKVASFGVAANQPMLDDQQAVATAQPLDASGNDISLPAGAVPTWSISPGTAATLGTPDPTGLTVPVIGVLHGTPGSETVTVSYTNSDGSIATGSIVYIMTDDPVEGDVGAFGVSSSTPVAQ